MWDCPACGCKCIAASLAVCPRTRCGRERPMPTATTGGSSNARALPGETGYVAPEETAAPVAVAEPETPAAPPAPDATAAAPEPAQPATDAPEPVPEPEPEAATVAGAADEVPEPEPEAVPVRQLRTAR